MRLRHVGFWETCRLGSVRLMKEARDYTTKIPKMRCTSRSKRDLRYNFEVGEGGGVQVTRISMDLAAGLRGHEDREVAIADPRIGRSLLSHGRGVCR